MTRRQKRISLIAAAVAVLGVAVGLVLYAKSDSIVFFLTPSEVATKNLPPGARVRLGGLVAPGSIKRGEGEKLAFDVTDGAASVHVVFVGLPPDLFGEGKGVVAEGALGSKDRLDADTILAKHDERYMPREVVEKLKAEGRWKESAN
jgi:cytochrome c-type biogenesis protein CcmE